MKQELEELLSRYPVLTECAGSLTAAFDLLARAFESGNKLLICGNGGSAADSEHIVGELMKAFVRPRPIPAAHVELLTQQSEGNGAYVAQRLQGALPAVSLVSQVSLNSAIANDIDAEMIFAQQVYGLGRAGDVLLGISTSGRARNVINAVTVARAFGMHTIVLTGRSGGPVAPLVDVAIRVPADTVVEIQELHLPVYHWLCIALEARVFTG